MALFNRVSIIGVGLIGGSLGMAIKKRGLAQEVVGAVRRPETIDAGISLGALDTGTLDKRESVRDADLVVVATPVGLTVPIFEEIATALAPGALVTDVGSAKAQIVRGAERVLPKHVRFVGGHPMAGSENAGVEAANADLFEGAIWVITPTEKTDPVASKKLAELAKAVGSKVIQLSPEDHDRAVAAVSHLPHVAAAALVNAVSELVAENAQAMELAAGGYHDTTRIAASLPGLWRDICLANKESLVRAIRQLSYNLSELEHALVTDNIEELERCFARASETRRSQKRRQ